MKKTILLSTLTLAFAAASASAQLYSTDFTSAEGYAEAGKINGIDGWSAQNGDTASLRSYDVAGTGELRADANFLRGYNVATAFAVGETITFTSDIRSIGGTTPGFTANLLQLGLTDDTNLGTSTVDAGVNLSGGGTNGANFGLAFMDPIGAASDTGIALNTVAYTTLTTTITKTATLNEFTVTGSLGGFDLGSTTITDAGLYSAATVYTLVFFAGQSNTGGIGLDNLTVAVPEPGTYALLAGMLALGAVMIRRRRS